MTDEVNYLDELKACGEALARVKEANDRLLLRVQELQQQSNRDREIASDLAGTVHRQRTLLLDRQRLIEKLSHLAGAGAVLAEHHQYGPARSRDTSDGTP